MFKNYYKMSYNPFTKQIKLSDVYMSKDYNQVHSRLNFLKQHGGIGLITSEPGYGKTFTIRTWMENQNINNLKFVYICLTTVTNREFFHQLCFCLGVEPTYRKTTLFRDIKCAISNYCDNKKMRVVIVIDEAHHLPPSILKDLQMITNFNMDSKDKLALVLVGHSVLNSILNRQPYESLRQRLVLNYSLEGLSENVAQEYVPSLLKSVGADKDIFDRSAITCAYDYSGGSIRRFNQIITNALIIGTQKRSRNIDTEIIRKAASELML